MLEGGIPLQVSKNVVCESQIADLPVFPGLEALKNQFHLLDCPVL